MRGQVWSKKRRVFKAGQRENGRYYGYAHSMQSDIRPDMSQRSLI